MANTNPRIAWNKGKLVGQKPPLRQEEVWQIRIRLELAKEVKELALFNLGIDSMLRASDLVSLKVSDISQGDKIKSRAMVYQQKTGDPVNFFITKRTRKSVAEWLEMAGLAGDDQVFKSRMKTCPHITSRHYGRIVKKWIESIGLNATVYGTHSMRRTKATHIYRQTKDIRAVQLLLGHSDIENTIQYLGVEVEDALDIAEKMDI